MHVSEPEFELPFSRAESVSTIAFLETLSASGLNLKLYSPTANLGLCRFPLYLLWFGAFLSSLVHRQGLLFCSLKIQNVSDDCESLRPLVPSLSSANTNGLQFWSVSDSLPVP